MMILDSEEQRKSLLALIEIAPVQGAVSQVRETVKALDKLKAEIAGASIAPLPPKKPEAPNASENQESKGRTET
jgi:hypothetical protein